MDFNLPPEIMNTQVTYGDLMKIFECLTSMLETSSDSQHKSLTTVVDLISDSIKNSEYKRIRDVKFFLNMLSNQTFKSINYWQGVYIDWCKEYDKLNKGDKDES